MKETTEKSVLMKCKTCNYQEEVPEWVMEELEEFSPSGKEGRTMICPECDRIMYEVAVNLKA